MKSKHSPEAMNGSPQSELPSFYGKVKITFLIAVLPLSAALVR